MKAVRLLNQLKKSSPSLFYTCCHINPSELQVRHSATIGGPNLKIFAPVAVKIRNLGLGPTSKDFEDPAQISGPMTKVHATELVLHLTDDERKLLHNALQEFDSNRIKVEFEGKLFLRIL